MIKLPVGVEIKSLIDDLRIFSWEASDILLNCSQILKDSNDKSNILLNDNIEDPVTLADLKVNKKILQRINEKYKDIDWEILSEENVKIDSDNFNCNSDWVWVLDPLDGTKDFIQGTTNYAMHLGLNYKKNPFLGVVLIPEKGELWISNGKKTWGEKRDGKRIKTILKADKHISDMTIITSKNHRNEMLRNLIEKVGFKKVKVMGSIGCKIASILRGESDIYICLSIPGKSAPKDWDFSAPEAILKTAGGAITNLDNEKLSYGDSNFQHGGIVVATNNNRAHQKICCEIKEIIKKFDIYPLED